MPNHRNHLSDRLIASLAPASAGQYRVRDTDLPGFHVVVGKRRKTFAVSADRWANGKRTGFTVSLGHFGEITTREARIEARAALARIAKGELTPKRGPAAAKTAPVTTLRSAWGRYLTSHMMRKGRSDATIAGYRDHIERLLKGWLDMPLADLANNPGLVADKHEELTKRSGPYAANGAMRSLRAVYNHARKTHRDLPTDNPTFGIDWNREIRRDTAMGAADLPRWFAEARRLRHPIRREFHLFMLLSGSRPGALMRAKREDLDLGRRVLRIPRPKGGEAKAFDIPLSRAMIRCLMRAIRMGCAMHPENGATWIFAADSTEGHLIEHKEPRSKLFKWGNDLRQTYRTLGQAAGVSRLDMHLLMNHTVPGVNEGYITRDRLMTDHLRRSQEKLSCLMLRNAAPGPGEAQGLWPKISSRRIGDTEFDPTPLDPRVALSFTRAKPRRDQQPPTAVLPSDDEAASPWLLFG